MEQNQRGSRNRKAVLELFQLGKEGIPPGHQEKDPKKKVYPYGYGLPFLTRVRLVLKVCNLRKLFYYVIGLVAGWLIVSSLLINVFPNMPRRLAFILFFTPLFLMVCLTVFMRYRRENPFLSYNGPSTKRGGFAAPQGLFLVILWISLLIYNVMQCIKMISGK